MWLLARQQRLELAIVCISGVLMAASIGALTWNMVARPEGDTLLQAGIILMTASGGVGIGYAAFCLLWSAYLAVLWGIDRYRRAISVRWV